MAKARYIYRCLPAPRRVKRARGQKTPQEAFAAAFEATLAEQAAAGWEYVRTDTAPMEAKSGFLSRLRETQEAVMVFRRPAAPGHDLDEDEDVAGHAEPVVAPGRRRRVAETGEEASRRPPPDIPRLGAARLD